MLRAEKKLLAGQLAVHRRQVDQLRARVEALQEQIDRQQGDSAAAEELAAEKRRVVALSGRLTALQETLDGEAKTRQLLAKQVAEGKRQRDLLQKQLRESESSILGLKRERERAAQLSEDTGRLLAAARGEIEQLKIQLRVRPVPAPAKVIEGKVTKVIEGGTAAQLSVGSADGVTIGMRFFLYRGSDFVGYLGVSEVADHGCAGELTRFETSPQPGDRASTTLELN